MPINLMQGLMAGANFGTGFQQGQQQSTQNNVANQMNQLALQDEQLKVDQDKLMAKQQQTLSDKAMQLFNPTGGGQQPAGGNPVPPSAMPGAPSTDSDQPVDKITQLANFAAGQGDLVRANELWTNAANLKNAQFEQEQKQSAMQTAELKRQQMHYGLAAQYAGTVEDTPAGFSQWKMAMLSDPNSSPQERQNISNMQYRPGILQKIRDSGATASQIASQQMREQEFAERQRVNDLQEMHRDIADMQRERRIEAMDRDHAAKKKVGAAAKAPTSTDVAQASAVVKQVMGKDADTSSEDFKLAATNIAGRALQIVQGNRAVTYPQALQMAAEEAKKNGEFTTIKTPDTHAHVPDWMPLIGGDKIPLTGKSPTNKPAFQQKGMTRDSAMPLPASKADLIPGRWYTANGKVEQYTGS